MNHGSKNPNSVLNEKKVKAINQLISSGKSCSEISLMYRVSVTTIKSIKTRSSWRHVTDFHSQLKTCSEMIASF